MRGALALAGKLAGGLLLLGFCRALVAPAYSQAPVMETPGARSVSGQFVAQAMRLENLAIPPGTLGTNTSYVQLEPTLLLISCERVKQILGRELAANSAWRGKIFVSLFQPRGSDDAVLVHAQWFRDHWDYEIRIPAVIERTRLIKGLVAVILLEMANRRAGDRSAELPAWLVEGLTAQLLATHEQEIILTLPQRSTRPVTINPLILSTHRGTPMEQVRKELVARGTLTFDELSWPTPAQLDGKDGGTYKSNAQLLVNQLMLLPGGREGLAAMVSLLPENLNWQFAFLRAYSGKFASLLDVEKWWTLQVVNFTGRDLSQTWPADESWLKLNQELRCRVQIRSTTNDLPLRGEVPLQSVIRDWAPQEQVPVLQSRLQALELLRVRVATNCLAVLDGYTLALRNYLKDSQRGGLLPFRKNAHRQQAAAEAVRRLDMLDRGRPVIPAPESAPPGATASEKGLGAAPPASANQGQLSE